MQTITVDMPEPEEFGRFLIWNYGELEQLINHLAETDDCPWVTDNFQCQWSDFVSEFEDYEIESLAGFERRIRREALKLDDAELRDVCHKVLGVPPKVFHTSGLREALSALAEARENES